MKAWHYSRARAGVRGARRFAAVATVDVRAASARASFVAGVGIRGRIRRDGGERDAGKRSGGVANNFENVRINSDHRGR